MIRFAPMKRPLSLTRSSSSPGTAALFRGSAVETFILAACFLCFHSWLISSTTTTWAFVANQPHYGSNSNVINQQRPSFSYSTYLVNFRTEFNRIARPVPSQLQAGGLEGLFPALGGGGSSSGTKSTSVANNFNRDGGVGIDPEEAFEATSIGLIRQARRLIASDFGILDPSLLSDNDDFTWIGPFVDEPLGKLEYLAAGRFFDLRGAFPDLDYRPHDFRIVEEDETDLINNNMMINSENDPSTSSSPLLQTIRITCRVTGTMRGALRLRDGTLPPTGKRMKCPPETVSITFNSYGKVVKLCTGFCMDRQVGNTKGSTGVMAAALVAGQPLSDWDLYPAPAVVNRFFGRPVEPLLESKSVLAPFPETVMIQLAKGILATNMAFNDPSLLSDNNGKKIGGFEFHTPYVGPIAKTEFLEKYALQEFENVDPSFSHFRVDPYDPVRVWIDVLPKGDGYQGCPQAMSFSFDEEGFCTRITSSYVLDPSIGNGGGLGGPEGYRYAMGQGTPDIFTRPWSRVVGRARKQILSPLTGVGVDDYITTSQARGGKTTISRSIRPGKRTPSSKDQQPKLLQSTPAESLSGLMAASGSSSSTTPAKSTEKRTEQDQQPSSPKSLLPITPPSPPAVVTDVVGEIRRRTLEAEQEEAKRLKQAGAQEADNLKKEVEAAENKALEARARKAAAQEKQQQTAAAAAAEKQRQQAAAAAEQKRLQQEKLKEAEQKRQEAQRAKASAAENAKARAEEAKAKRAEANRRAAEERKQRQAAVRAEAERKKLQIEANRAAAAEKRKQQLAARQTEAERKKQALQAAAQVKKEKAQEQAKAQAEAKRIAAQKKVEDQKQQTQRKRVAAKSAAEAKKKLAQTQKAVEAKQKQRAAATAASKAKEQEDSAARAARQKAALDSLSNAVTRATVSLFGVVGFGESDTSSSASSSSSMPSSGSIQIPKPSFGSIQIPGITNSPSSASKSVASSASPSSSFGSIQIPGITANAQSPPSSSAGSGKTATKKTQPPRGVPVIKRWRKTPSGAITGVIYNSRNFDDGDRVTTSPIASGTISSGEIVRTGSGSRYFLS